jgi:hypothetical protein
VLAKRETFAALSLVLAGAGIFLLAFGIRTTWLPDVVPVADPEALRSVWGLEAAVLLKAVENIAGFGAVLVLMAFAIQRIQRWAQSPTSRD